MMADTGTRWLGRAITDTGTRRLGRAMTDTGLLTGVAAAHSGTARCTGRRTMVAVVADIGTGIIGAIVAGTLGCAHTGTLAAAGTVADIGTIARRLIAMIVSDR